MNLEHYKMAKAFAREYGTFLGGAWCLTFLLIVLGMSYGMLLLSLLGFLAFGLLLVLPFFFAWRFKQHLSDGERMAWFPAWTFTSLMFLYASLLTLVVEFAYLKFIDGGRMLATMSAMLSTPLVEQQYSQMGASEMLATCQQQLADLAAISPFDIALSLFSNNILWGFILTIPVMMLAHQACRKTNRNAVKQ